MTERFKSPQEYKKKFIRAMFEKKQEGIKAKLEQVITPKDSPPGGQSFLIEEKRKSTLEDEREHN